MRFLCLRKIALARLSSFSTLVANINLGLGNDLRSGQIEVAKRACKVTQYLGVRAIPSPARWTHEPFLQRPEVLPVDDKWQKVTRWLS